MCLRSSSQAVHSNCPYLSISASSVMKQRPIENLSECQWKVLLYGRGNSRVVLVCLVWFGCDCDLLLQRRETPGEDFHCKASATCRITSSLSLFFHKATLTWIYSMSRGPWEYSFVHINLSPLSLINKIIYLLNYESENEINLLSSNVKTVSLLLLPQRLV